MDLNESQIDPALQYLDERESQWPESPTRATQSTQRDSASYTPPASRLYSQPSRPYTQRASQRARRAARIRTDWTPAMELAMLNTFIDTKKWGLETDNSNYKSVVWPAIVEAVSQHTSQSITKDICDNRWRKIKTIWKLWLCISIDIQICDNFNIKDLHIQKSLVNCLTVVWQQVIML
ncbi:hypothetical protein I7I51_06660 [Histoplasma capsulatum]|uniref:Myb/SANT-like domain-containing protein n=1 Tax=Ajellomyces capsulatus TaxID=5037 RepID=A0A8A1MKZ7_AJECA|nr:hypothetical protein I7I51_06660 [Histoplasma capsulatum]